MKTPEGRMPGFEGAEKPRHRRSWNLPWTDRSGLINEIPTPRGVPAMKLDGTLDGTESEDIDA